MKRVGPGEELLIVPDFAALELDFVPPASAPEYYFLISRLTQELLVDIDGASTLVSKVN